MDCRAIANLALVMAAACAAPARSPPPPAVVVTSAPARAAAEPRVEVTLASAPRILYSPAAMHAPRPSVRITVTNTEDAEIDVENVRIRIELTRDGVPIRCSESEVAAAREPHVLAPGETAVYVRTMDCPLSLAGAYAARVVVAFGASGPWAEGRVVRELAITVAAPPDAQPHPIASVPGLFAAIGSGNVIPATMGKGRVVVALVNARNERILLPPMQIALAVRRVGTNIPCGDEPAPLAAPAALDAGATVALPIEVSCLGFGVTGAYDVEARLLVANDEQRIGVLRVEVTSDPARINSRVLP